MTKFLFVRDRPHYGNKQLFDGLRLADTFSLHRCNDLKALRSDR